LVGRDVRIYVFSERLVAMSDFIFKGGNLEKGWHRPFFDGKLSSIRVKGRQLLEGEMTRRVNDSLKSLEGRNVGEISRIVLAVEDLLYRTSLNREGIAAVLNGESEFKLPARGYKRVGENIESARRALAGVKVDPVFVWFLNKTIGVREKDYKVRSGRAVTPQISKLVSRIKKFDEGTAVRIAVKHRLVDNKRRPDWQPVRKARRRIESKRGKNNT